MLGVFRVELLLDCLVYLTQDQEEEDEEVDAHVDEDEPHHHVTKVVPLLRARHKLSEQKQALDAYEEHSLVDDLDHVVQDVVHRHHGQVKGQDYCGCHIHDGHL